MRMPLRFAARRQRRQSEMTMWVQDLSQVLGLGPLTPGLLGGNDFAFGDAETGTTLAVHGDSDRSAQPVEAFEAAAPLRQPQALYTLWMGSNDLLDNFGSTLSPAQMVGGGMQAIANAYYPDHGTRVSG
jgi:hypothetical protein